MDILGFHSAFQLSKHFKQHVGEAPQHWRLKRGQRTAHLPKSDPSQLSEVGNPRNFKRVANGVDWLTA